MVQQHGFRNITLKKFQVIYFYFDSFFSKNPSSGQSSKGKIDTAVKIVIALKGEKRWIDVEKSFQLDCSEKAGKIINESKAQT